MADLVRRLHLAIQSNDFSAIEAAVSAGADMDHTWGAHGTALCQAISVKNLELVKLLVDMGADVNIDCFDGISPLGKAAREKQADIALYLISQPKCDLNAWDPVSKQRILHDAVREGLTEVVETMIQDPRCDITKGNGVGNTALHVAFTYRQNGIAKILARCECLHFIQNYAGFAPIHIAAAVGSFEEIDILFPSHSRTTEGEMYHRLADAEADTDDQEEMVKLRQNPTQNPLVQRELDQKAAYCGNTALHIAVKEKHFELARKLIKMGASVDIQNSRGQTALLTACILEECPMMLELLRGGAPPNLAGNAPMPRQTRLASFCRESSLTPLHLAAASNKLDVVKMLLEFGADVNVCDERNRCPLMFALLSGASEVALHFLSLENQSVSHVAMGEATLLHAVSSCEDGLAGRITEILLERGCSISARDRRGNQPLHQAVCFANLAVARVLLEHGASPSIPGELGSFPLAIAARTGKIAMAHLLLSAGADLNAGEAKEDKDSISDTDDEDTPLREALNSEDADFVRFLVKAGCDLTREKYLFDCDLEKRVFVNNTPVILRASDLGDSDSSDYDDDDDDDDDDEDNVISGMPTLLQTDQALFYWLKNRATNTHALFHLSLEAVRSHFRHGNPPFHMMTALPVPEKIKRELFFRTLE